MIFNLPISFPLSSKEAKPNSPLAVPTLVLHVHQAGVAPLLRDLASRPPPGPGDCDHVLFLGTYLPPYALSGDRGDALILHDFQNDVDGFSVRLDALSDELPNVEARAANCRRHFAKVALAKSADPAPVVAALARRNATLAEERAFRPHFSGEIPPRALGDLALVLYDVRDVRGGARWRLRSSTEGP